MKVVALVSGGKDSCYNAMLCMEAGHEVVALANLYPLQPDVDELDSYMYQTVGHQLVAHFAACTGLPLLRRRIYGGPRNQAMAYQETEADEVEDLYTLLAYASKAFPGLEAVSCGAIASDYQRLRVEHVCARLGLVSLAYMWRQPQALLLRAMVASGVHAVLVKVAALGLEPDRHLGRSLAELEPELLRLRQRWGCNPCGEGGEYETLVLDCPIFRAARIVLDAWVPISYSPAGPAAVAALHPTRFHLEPKPPPPEQPQSTEAMPAAAPPAGIDGDASAVDACFSAPAAWNLEVPPDYMPQGRGPQPNSGNQRLRLEGQDRASGGVGQWHSPAHMRKAGGALHMWCRPEEVKAPKHGTASAAERVCGALHAALDAIEAGLRAAGRGLGEATLVLLYLANMACFGAMNEVYRARFPATQPPARACVEAALPAGCPLAIDILLPAQGAGERRVLHVQSISRWAPASIGPYAQAVAQGRLLYMAGQIGLDPASMALVPGGAGPQAARALSSCQAVAGTMAAALPQAALAWTAYAAHPSGDAGPGRAESECRTALAAAREALDAAVAGTGRDDPDRNGDDGDSGLDSQPLAMRPGWQPLTTYAAVPALPRGALVELQPLACTLLPGVDPDEPEEGCPGHEAACRAGDERAKVYKPNADAGATPLPGWLQHVHEVGCQAQLPHGLLCRMLAAQQVFGLLQVSLCHEGQPEDRQSEPHWGTDAACCAICQCVDTFLGEAHLPWDSVLSMRCFHRSDAWALPDLQQGFASALTQFGGRNGCPLAVCFVPVIAVGPDPYARALLHVDLVAMTLCSPA